MKENKEIVVDIQDTIQVCKELLKTQHYQKIGNEGIFAIVQKAKALGIHPLKALNGGMYFVQGKVEMSSAMMNELIRLNKHSITKDRKSDDTICILHGKRADNNDTWTESFSIEDAKRAGIYRNQWLKYPKDMLFARALSRLARQLFPDVIQGCYVQGEISVVPEVVEKKEESVTAQEVKELEQYLSTNEALKQNITNYLLQEYGVENLDEIPRDLFDKVLPKAKAQYEPLVFGEEEQQAMGE
jgi:hypothetical protein